MRIALPACDTHCVIDVADLEDVVVQTRDDLEALRNARLFITGGTGFVGTWLLSALHHADARLGLRMHTTVLTRDPEAFAARQPTLADWTELVRGEVTATPEVGLVDAVVHAATPASAAFNDRHPELMRNTIVDGLESALSAIAASGRIPFLFTSSGAVYGPQPVTLERIPESYEPAPESIEPRNAYALGKRDAEAIAIAAADAGGPSLRLARLFAFVGPLLPLDAHFAIGNFTRDALVGGPIIVQGDGLAVRSYMYAADLVVALLAILIRGEESLPYNVGSPNGVTIESLARTVEAVVRPGCGVTVMGRDNDSLPTGAGNRYVPDTTRLAGLLGNDPCRRDLEGSIRATAAWAQSAAAER